MLQKISSPPPHKKTVPSAARIRAAFFVPFFTVMIVVTALILRQNTAAADTIPIAETLGYQLVELSGKEAESLEIALQGENISEQETIDIAKELYAEAEQAVIVFATSQPTTAASYNEQVQFKVMIKDEVIETIDFEVYKDVPSEKVDHEWDLSDNVLDLVTGKVTIQIQMDEHWTKQKILATAKALSERVIAHNQASGVASVFLKIQVGGKTYVFDSDYINALGDYRLINL